VKLSTRLVILILSAAIPVFAVQISHDLAVRENAVSEITRRAETLTNLATARQDRIVEAARLLLAATSHLPSIIEPNPAVCARRLKEIASHAPELTAIAVLTPDGERWCSSLGSQSVSLRDRPYFQETLRTGTMQTSNYIIGRVTGEGSVVFTYPAKSPEGSIRQVVFVAYRTSVLSRLLNDPPLPPGAVVVVLDSEGFAAARWPEPEKWMGQNLSGSDVVRRAVSERRGALRGFADWAGPGEFAFAFSPMQAPTSFTVVAALPLSSAMEAADAAFWRSVGWTTLIFLLAATVAIVGSRFTVVRPIRKLQGFADALASGNISARPPNDTSGAMELRELTGHLDAMGRALEQQQSQLTEAIRHKEVLLKEVNHRVKNSLQLVASLFALQRSSIKDAEARRQFEEAGRRINIVAQIHQRLYQDDNVELVALDRFLNELCADLQSVLGGDKNITITCDADACYLPTDQVIPVAMIVNELITNAFKYAYSSRTSGVIWVTCEHNAKSVTLAVSDDGDPMPPEFEPSKSAGLGMRMVTGLTKQLRASMEVIPLAEGKRFVLRLPVSEGRHAL
jgi:two-component sensor histidine kinase